MKNEVLDLEARQVSNGREIWRPFEVSRSRKFGIVALVLGVIALCVCEALGLNDEAMSVGLALASLAALALMFGGRRKLSQVYRASALMGCVGLVLLAGLPGAWALVGVPLMGCALVAFKVLEKKGWVHA